MLEPYIDETYYKTEYEGEPVTGTDFYRFSNRATSLIDALTEYKIREIGFDKFTEQVQVLIKNAVCAQVEYYQIEGINTDITGTTRTSGSMSIGSFSYSGNTFSTNKQANRVAPACLTYLEGTGLLRKRKVRIGVI